MASVTAAMGNGRLSDLLHGSVAGSSLSGTLLRLKCLGICRTMTATGRRTGYGFTVSAKLRKVKKYEYPWPDDADPNVKGGVLSHLSSFKPLKEKQKPVTLAFEKPLVDLQKKIIEVQKMANETGLDFTDQIVLLENKYQQALKDLYTHLTPIQRVNIARHPNRPTFLDHIFNITDKFVELHGDRAGYDDPAIVTGIGTIDGERYMFMGHQKGRNTKENIQRNFGMPTPHGYRKALRMMYYADHHGFPIITFIDTPGAFADLKSEELGQGEAIAHNLRTMFGLKVPIVSIVIGEGGSGGALAIGCANKLLMLENAVFYVASPEACAAILWKSAKASPQAAEKLKITATELCKLQIADGIIPEPLGGAHADPSWTSQQIKLAVVESMSELKKMNTEEMLKHRMLKFRKIGGFQEGIPIDPKRKVNMKKKEEPPVGMISDKELEGEVEKLKQQILKAKDTSAESPDIGLSEMIEKLQREVAYELSEAIKATGSDEKYATLQEQLSKLKSQDQTSDPVMSDELVRLRDEINQGLPSAPNYSSLQNKAHMLEDLIRTRERERFVSFKQELVKKVKEVLSRPESADIGLSEMIEKLQREVAYELSKAIKATGLDEKYGPLQEQLSKLKCLDQTSDPVMYDKFAQLTDEINQGLPSAPNYSSLQNKAHMLEDLIRVSEEERFVSFKQDLVEKVKEVLSRSDIKREIEDLRGDIKNSGSGPTTFEDLDQGLKEKYLKVYSDIRAELGNSLTSMGVVEVTKSKNLSTDAAAKVKQFNEKIRLQIEGAMNESDVKNMIQILKLLAAEVGDMPSKEIEALVQQIKQKVSGVVNSLELRTEYEELMAEINGDHATPDGYGGAMGNGVPSDGNIRYMVIRETVNVGGSHVLP